MPYIELVIGLGLIFLYLIFPPSVIIAMRCWIRRVQKKMGRSEGMQRLRDSARKEAMKNISRQVSLYLFSFWFVWVFVLVHTAYMFLTGKVLYGLLIVSTCLSAMEGFVYAVVYFALQSLGTPKVTVGRTSCVSVRSELTVKDIRINAENKIRNVSEGEAEREESYVFNIFDGVADADSPWAKFINEDDSEFEGDFQQEGGPRT